MTPSSLFKPERSQFRAGRSVIRVMNASNPQPFGDPDEHREVVASVRAAGNIFIFVSRKLLAGFMAGIRVFVEQDRGGIRKQRRHREHSYHVAFFCTVHRVKSMALERGSMW